MYDLFYYNIQHYANFLAFDNCFSYCLNRIFVLQFKLSTFYYVLVLTEKSE